MTSSYREKIEAQKQGGPYKVADFPNGREVTHVISTLIQDVPLYDKQADILHFQDTTRQLQVNVTNGETLMSLFGDDPQGWAGHKVTLYLDEYRPGKFGIRIKAPAAKVNGPQTPAITKPASMDDEIPF